MTDNQTQSERAQQFESRKQSGCGICKALQPPSAPPPKCNGHGGGSGGGSGSSESEQALNKSESNPSNSSTATADTLNLRIPGSSIPRLEPSSRIFDEEVIKELLSKGLLTIENDGKTLSIGCNLNLLNSEQESELNKFINAIKDEFEKFKNEKINSATNWNTKEINDGNKFSLTIHIPNTHLFSKFIERLQKMQSPEQAVENTMEQNVKEPVAGTKSPRPSCYSIIPRPPGSVAG